MHDPRFEIRDAIHGFVTLSQAERLVLDTTTFERLRDIRQLAMGHMVYPGANHTRLEHSLGCLHLASEALDILVARHERETYKPFADAFNVGNDGIRRGKKILRVAALLHDVGHSAFSHSGEHLLPRVKRGRRKVAISHEEMTASIVRDTEIGEVINDVYRSEGINAEDVISVGTSPSLANGDEYQTPWHEFLNGIIAGELGVDRIDYLLRDSWHSGQRAGAFDYRKLMASMMLVPVPLQAGDDTRFRLGLDEGGWLVAEQMVVARYLMYISLYFHKTKRICEIHLEDFLAAWLKSQFGVAAWPASPIEFAKLTDSAALAAMAVAARSPKRPGHDAARRLVERRHFRMARELVLADNYVVPGPAEDGSGGPGGRVPDRERFDRLWKSVSIKFGSLVKRDAADHSATRIFSSDSKILVYLDGKPRYLADLSEIVRGMSGRIWRGRIYADDAVREEVAAACERFLSKHPVIGDDGDD